jgi:hypothetical protein
MSRRLVIALALVACHGSPSLAPDGSDAPGVLADVVSSDASADGPACIATAPVVDVPARAHKLSQLIGDFDREQQAPTTTQTFTRFGLDSTDLGASFPYGGRTYFLFGDSNPSGGGNPNAFCGDSIAWSTDTDPSDGLSLDFVADANGTFHSPVVPGVDLGCYDVPLDGADVNGAMYVWFSTDTMTRSILARSDDSGATFTKVLDFSSSHFINISVVREGDDLLLFGSGLYRGSEVYLARVPAAHIEDPTAYTYFSGLAADGCTPNWSADEASAAPLFGPTCVGELSAHHLPELDAWVVLYNCGDPRGIQARVARAPGGPWSDAALVFDPWADGGYCHYMHTSYDFENCDSVQDPGSDTTWGGEYGPYLVEPLTQAVSAHDAVIHFILSTWNPYTTVLMRAELAWH